MATTKHNRDSEDGLSEVSSSNGARDEDAATENRLTETAEQAPAATVFVAAVGALIVLALTLYLAFAPTFTNDFWFHLKMGEVYWTQGLWPAADPMLHTALPNAPIQHEWLFGVLLYLVESLAGFFGIRGFHLLAVATIIAMVFVCARRATRNVVAACFVATLFALLAWTRLFQLRPDLVTIIATLATYVLLLEQHRVSTARRLVAFCVLILIWANAHSLFALAPLLLFASMLGLGVRALVEANLLEGSDRTQSLRLTRNVAGATLAAIVLALAISLANPRGIEQHLTFFTSSADTAIWSVKDEWSHFTPLDLDRLPGSVGPLLWVTMDGLMLLFGATAIAGAISIVRRRKSSLRIYNPATFALGAASIVAILVSIRFLWMSVFPLLFVAQAITHVELRRDLRGILLWGLALATLIVSIAFYRDAGLAKTLDGLPSGFTQYIETPYVTRKFHVEGVRFLYETEVEGRLFNSYGMGGFLGYWLSPRLETYIDSRTEHYPPEVMKEYSRVAQMRELRGRKTFLDILDRRGVDFFFGVGMPTGLVKRSRSSESTTRHLEGIDGWVVVSRSIRHAIYLRDLSRNHENFQKIARYYASVGIPFDRRRGFDAAAAIDANLEWSIENGLMTPEHAARIAMHESSDPKNKAIGLDALAWVYVLGGSYKAALGVEDELAKLRPATSASLRREIYSALKLEDIERAKRRSAELVRATSQDTDSLIFQQLVTAFSETAASITDAVHRDARAVALSRITQRVPLLSIFEAALLERGLPGEPRVAAIGP